MLEIILDLFEYLDHILYNLSIDLSQMCFHCDMWIDVYNGLNLESIFIYDIAILFLF